MYNYSEIIAKTTGATANMMKFFKKYILIPNGSLLTYFYLIYMLPLIWSIFPIKNIFHIITLFLIVIFYLVYRQGYNEESQTDQLFLLQMAVSIAITLVSGYVSVFIFFAFAFNFWAINQKTRRKYFICYYISVFISSLITLWMNLDFIPTEAWQWIGLGFIFVIFSPVLAAYIARENEKVYQLSLNNTRLEMLIRQKERDRIARDLHDNLGQTYSTMTIKAELASKLLDRDNEAVRRELVEIANMSRQNLNTVRQIVSDLQERSIAEAMIDASETLKNRGILLVSQGEAVTEDWPLDVQHVFAAIIKEATTNILRHSQASRSKYEFAKNGKSYWVGIQDNGVGIRDSDQLKSYGIEGMRQRAQELGGEFSIKNQSGTRLEIKIPEEGNLL